MAAGRVGQYTIERQEGVFKIEVPGPDIITAFTRAIAASSLLRSSDIGAP